MIRSKKELDFYIKADYMINRGCFKPTFVTRIKQLLFPDLIMQYLICMRKTSYYSHQRCFISKIKTFYYYRKFSNLGLKLGFSIGKDVFGYALVIPHYGTIVVNDEVKCGNYCVLHTSTCIGGGKKYIGNGLYMSAGAKIFKNIKCGDAITLAANSILTTSTPNNKLMIGSPAVIKKDSYPIWYERDGQIFKNRYNLIEKLRCEINVV